MRRPERALAAALLLAAAAAVPARALKVEVYGRTPAALGGRPIRVASGHALVQLSSGTAASSLDAALAGFGARRVTDLGGGWLLVSWSDASTVAQKLALLRSVPGLAQVQPDYAHTVDRVPDDPLVNAQYALDRVDAFGAWEFDTGASTRVTIAVIDTGIDGTQPDLKDKLTNTVSLAFDPTTGVQSADNPPTAACEHATEVSGVAAASSDNGLQVAGMSWGAQLVSYKVFSASDCNADCSDNGGNLCQTSDTAIIAALNKAASFQTDPSYGHVVVNMSLGGAGSCAAALQTAVTNAVNAGVVVVAAAGNDSSAVNTPGDCDGVITMGASDSSDQIAYFSSRGTVMTAHGLVAPGVSVLTTAPGGGTSSPSGTSFSSPMGAGLAALMLSAKPTLQPSDVLADMRGGADDIGQPSTLQGAGRLNAYRTMRLVVKGTLAGFDGESKPIAFPNPFRLSRSPRVSFALPPGLQTSGAKIKIYTQDGRFVREVDGLSWDGRNGDGNLVATGTYVFVVENGGSSTSGRMAVIR
ncbi:MAG: S8 family serine peptidase [Elusimicrobia bacterium]|nr:S8 family serine peptidase [Elusimicrobiota bacterium]